MGKESNIAWCDATWNIARGCTKVDADCLFCYMMRDGDRYKYDGKTLKRTKTVFNLPLKIKPFTKSSVWPGDPLVFTSSLTDFFHKDADSFRDEAWDIIRRCPHLTFQILTKRPERIAAHLPADWGGGWNNVWLGTSIGSQKSIQRIDELLKVPAKLHFLSLEPLHGKIDLSLYLVGNNNPIHGIKEQRRDSLQGNFSQGTNNRQDGQNLESSPTKILSVGEKDGDVSLQKAQSGAQSGGILSGSCHDQREENLRTSSQIGLFSLQRKDTIRADGESRRREEEKQPSEQSDFSNSQRSNETHGTSVEERQGFESSRGEKFNVQVERSTSSGDSDAAKIRPITKSDSESIRSSIPNNLKNSERRAKIGWCIVGGESGNENGKWGYRPCELEWIGKIIEQCQETQTPVFVKQLGTHLSKSMNLSDRHGGDISEWADFLKVRQFPNPELVCPSPSKPFSHG